MGQRRLRLGELRSERDRRHREEAALKDLRESLNQLRGELKVSPKACAMAKIQDLDADAQSTEAPWRAQNDALTRHRAERQNAENDASLQVGLYRSSLNELESKHQTCQS